MVALVTSSAPTFEKGSQIKNVDIFNKSMFTASLETID